MSERDTTIAVSLLDIADCRMLGISDDTWRRMRARGLAPAAIRLPGKRRAMWLAADIFAYLARCTESLPRVVLASVAAVHRQNRQFRRIPLFRDFRRNHQALDEHATSTRQDTVRTPDNFQRRDPYAPLPVGAIRVDVYLPDYVRGPQR